MLREKLRVGRIGPTPLAPRPRHQFGEVQRVGSARTENVDIRFVAATNRDLEEEVRNKRFRQDLFFRLNAVVYLIFLIFEQVMIALPLPAQLLHPTGAAGSGLGTREDGALRAGWGSRADRHRRRARRW